MSEYTPTTEEVRESFYIHTFNRDMEHLRAEAFDRWLAAHDAEIRTAALEEAAVIADSTGHHWSGQPATACFEIAEAIRALAATKA